MPESPSVNEIVEKHAESTKEINTGEETQNKEKELEEVIKPAEVIIDPDLKSKADTLSSLFEKHGVSSVDELEKS